MQYVNDITSSINQFKMIYVTISSKHCKYACIRKINSQILDNEVVVHRKKYLMRPQPLKFYYGLNSIDDPSIKMYDVFDKCLLAMHIFNLDG